MRVCSILIHSAVVSAETIASYNDVVYSGRLAALTDFSAQLYTSQWYSLCRLASAAHGINNFFYD
jgi:hypothetical protein